MFYADYCIQISCHDAIISFQQLGIKGKVLQGPKKALCNIREDKTRNECTVIVNLLMKVV